MFVMHRVFNVDNERARPYIKTDYIAVQATVTANGKRLLLAGPRVADVACTDINT